MLQMRRHRSHQRSAAILTEGTGLEARGAVLKTILAWLNDALATKDIGAGMTYYRVQGGDIRATNGRITASHPWPYGGEFLVAGAEFEAVLKRMKNAPTLSVVENGIKIKDGRFSGTIKTLPVDEWSYPGVDDAAWQPIPASLLGLLKALRPFISETSSQAWATCVALDGGWCLATNNIAIAGGKCEGLNADANLLLPPWILDFVLSRAEGLEEWTWSESFVAFRWASGAWARSQLIVGQFPEKAATMVKASASEVPTQIVTDEFRDALKRVGELADDTVSIYANRIVAKFGKALVEDGIECEVPPGAECSMFGAKFLLPVMKEADTWSPGSWPKPTVWRGKIISGYCVGRRA